MDGLPQDIRVFWKIPLPERGWGDGFILWKKVGASGTVTLPDSKAGTKYVQKVAPSFMLSGGFEVVS
jgi:hypothetical protein